MTLASLIVPAYNVEQWLPKCLDSILGQSYSELEVILINDGSTDGTGDVAEAYAEQDSRVRLAHQENQGLSAVRNRGIRVADGDLIFLVDSDDWIHRDLVRDVIAAFNKHSPDVVMFQCSKYYDSTGAWSGGTDDFYWNSVSSSAIVLPDCACDPRVLALYPLAVLKAMSREYIKAKRLRFIEGLKYEDNPFHVSLIACSPRVHLLAKRYYAWRQGRPGQITSTGHPDDALTALESMAARGFDMGEEYHPYLLVGMTRLAAGVARAIKCPRDRRFFLVSASETISRMTPNSNIDTALSRLTCLPVHLGDQLLTRCLLISPATLASVFDNGYSRYLGAMRSMFNAVRNRRGGIDVAVLNQASREYRSLGPYSRGVGDKGVCSDGSPPGGTTAYVWNG